MNLIFWCRSAGVTVTIKHFFLGKKTYRDALRHLFTLRFDGGSL
jgi:hypothetical protein